MSADVAPRTDGVVPTPHLAGVAVAQRFRTSRTSAESTRDRRLHALGRAVLRIPPSSWMLVDIAVLTAGIHFGYRLFPPPAELATPHITVWQALPVFVLTTMVASLVFGLYERETVLSRTRILTRIALTVVTAAILTYAVIYVAMYMTISRRLAACTFTTFLLTGGLIRWLAWSLAHKVQCGLLIVGPRTLYDSFHKSCVDGILNQYRVVGYASGTQAGRTDVKDPAYLGPIEAQLDRVDELGVTDIVVGGNAARDTDVMDWVVPFLQHGCRVTNEAIFHETSTGQILVDQISPSWFLFADLKVHCDEHATVKRLTDVLLAGVGLCLAAPLWPLIALAIKLCDRGPVHYSQLRVGQNGQVFKLYKFRTMRTDAENGKSIWCAPNDPRVTRVGRFLRKSRLDELPQLFNVLVGQMALVGPRPERPDIVNELCQKIPFYAERHLVKPGITGWAQISFRYGNNIEDSKRKLQYDLYYLKHMSLELDMMILFRTVGTFLKGAC